MDNPGKSGMPAFQRAKPSGGSMRAPFHVSDTNEPSGSSLGKGARHKGTLVHSNSVQVSFDRFHLQVGVFVPFSVHLTAQYLDIFIPKAMF